MRINIQLINREEIATCRLSDEIFLDLIRENLSLKSCEKLLMLCFYEHEDENLQSSITFKHISKIETEVNIELTYRDYSATLPAIIFNSRKGEDIRFNTTAFTAAVKNVLSELDAEIQKKQIEFLAEARKSKVYSRLLKMGWIETTEAETQVVTDWGIQFDHITSNIILFMTRDRWMARHASEPIPHAIGMYNENSTHEERYETIINEMPKIMNKDNIIDFDELENMQKQFEAEQAQL